MSLRPAAPGLHGVFLKAQKLLQGRLVYCLPLIQVWDIRLVDITLKAEIMGSSNHQNSFDAMRFILSSAVLFSHHFALSGYVEPKFPFLDISVGNFAVFAFFTISGFLMYGSLNRSNNFFCYFTSRILRLAPGLIVAVIITSLLLMYIFDNFSNLNAHLLYIRRDSFSFMSEPSYFIRGVFDDRPNRGVNGSLWTLQYEFFLYIVIFLVFFLPRKALPIALIFLMSACLFGYYAHDSHRFRLGTFHLNSEFIWSNGLHFFMGATIAHFWRLISTYRITSLIASSCLAVVFIFVFPFAKLLGLGFLWVPFLFVCMSRVAGKFSRLGDPSYGVYIYAFPIQQVMIIFIASFWLSMFSSFLLTASIGYLCWHTIEKKALAHRRTIASFLNNAPGAFRNFLTKFLNSNAH
ncbi:acyltransferase family protein [Brucella pituitosa]|uniref:acyltransferase family protein n=1 Tax=Brucella pituitosa TaxID=571256 RepID=UPI0013747250|nr:acyltransferase [Brucella pituitosa]